MQVRQVSNRGGQSKLARIRNILRQEHKCKGNDAIALINTNLITDLHVCLFKGWREDGSSRRRTGRVVESSQVESNRKDEVQLKEALIENERWGKGRSLSPRDSLLRYLYPLRTTFPGCRLSGWCARSCIRLGPGDPNLTQARKPEISCTRNLVVPNVGEMCQRHRRLCISHVMQFYKSHNLLMQTRPQFIPSEPH